MAATSWDEIKILAKDLQRVQLSGTAQRLSERNCIEIVQRLSKLSLIDVIYTTDGKQYITPLELSKEIREDLIANNGRVDLIDLQQSLNVDLSHIETKVNELVKSDRNLTLVLGQLIDRSYMDHLADEINDKLQEQGQVTVAELAKHYDLPGDFIYQMIQLRIGQSIQAVKDEHDRNFFYTDMFVARHCAKIRGAFSAVMRPTPIQKVMMKQALQEQLFYSILERLITEGRLPGSVSGGWQDKATYIPNCYMQSQNAWIDSFFSQNGYLEYDSLSRLGIMDPLTFIKRRLKTDSVEYLTSCCIGQLIKDRIESEIDEALDTGTWVDIMPVLPSICTSSDCRQVFQNVLLHRPSAIVYSDSFVTCESFLERCLQPFNQLLKAKAELAVRDNPSIMLSQDISDRIGKQPAGGRSTIADERLGPSTKKDDRKDQQTKKGGSKSGGGLTGREIKTKSTKKKGFGSKDKNEDRFEPDDDDSKVASTKKQPEFMNLKELELELKRQDCLKECQTSFLVAIAQDLHRRLKRQYEEELRSVFLQTMQSSIGESSASGRKKTNVDLVEKLNGMWMNAKLFELGIQLFDDDLQIALSKHLLKTVCTDILNILLGICAADYLPSVNDAVSLTPEMRTNILSTLPDEKVKIALNKLNGTLYGKTVDEFFIQLDIICNPGGILELRLKKPDKKKDRQLIFNHRQSLVEQLRIETDPAMTLHLAVILLVQAVSQRMVHAPGRCVPQIITYLQDKIPLEQHQLLVKLQDCVVLQIKSTSEFKNVVTTTLTSVDCDTKTTALVFEGQNLDAVLLDLVPKVKEIALSAKKFSSDTTSDA